MTHGVKDTDAYPNTDDASRYFRGVDPDDKMNTCKTCKHWVDIWEDREQNVGACYMLTPQYPECSENADKCRVYSSSDPIGTEENFGCIHHEELE